MALNRDRLLTALATVTCLRVSEVVRLQVCDLWFHYFESMALPGMEGLLLITLSIARTTHSAKDITRPWDSPEIRPWTSFTNSSGGSG